MKKCLNCGRFPFCEEAEENKKECENWVKRVEVKSDEKK